MRTGLIAALTRTAGGAVRAELPLAGRSVLAWQVDLLRSLGAERILCLCDAPSGEVLRVQHDVEAAGIAFHALNGFSALPALVRAEDDLIILRDGLMPDPAVVGGWIGAGPVAARLVAALPADHPLVAAFPEDFERIDATRHWAGFLVMRGAPVQLLAEFPADADPVSVLLRLALQAGTPCRLLGAAELTADRWLLAASDDAVMQHEQALIAGAASGVDWRAPLSGFATELVRRLAPRGLAQGAQVSGGASLALLLAAIVVAALGQGWIALTLGAAGSFAAQMSAAYAGLSARLRRQIEMARLYTTLSLIADGLVAILLWFALAPWPAWSPLAICGPLTIGLARLANRIDAPGLAALASDRPGQLAALALAAGIGLLPEAVATMAAALMLILLLRPRAN